MTTMRERPKLRVVKPGEVPVPDGDLQAVLDDLEIARGHLIEATAEARECEGDVVELVDQLLVAEDAVTKAQRTARIAKARS
jgi:hypothetical protein